MTEASCTAPTRDAMVTSSRVMQANMIVSGKTQTQLGVKTSWCGCDRTCLCIGVGKVEDGHDNANANPSLQVSQHDGHECCPQQHKLHARYLQTGHAFLKST